MPCPSDPTPELLFASWLESREGGEETDFDAFCRAHASHAEGLRTLRRKWLALREVMGQAGMGGSLAEQLASRYGPDLDPRVTLGAGESDPGAPSSAVLSRLAARDGDSMRYRIQGEVGQGGMGAVLRVWDEDLRRPLAMKVMLGRGSPRVTGDTPPVDARLLARFLEEAQVTGQLDHPGIVPVHQLGLDREGHAYFTMKLVQGRTLLEVLDELARGEGGWTRTRVLGLCLKVCEAVSYAHAKGVIHRDLKPTNVMVGRFGEVYVMDWGLAKVLGQERDADGPRALPAGERADPVESLRSEDDSQASLAGTVLGTPAYMPPEQARGEVQRLDRRADVFALGAILFQVLTGEPLYPVERTAALRAAREARVDDALRRLEPPAVEPELAALVRECLSPDPDDRPRDAREVAERLDAFLTGAEQRVVEARISERAAHRTKKLALATAVVVAAALVASLRFWSTAEEARAEAVTNLSNFNALRLVHRLDEVEGSLAELYPAARADTGTLERWLREEWGPLEPDLAELEAALGRLEGGELQGADRFLWETLRQVHTRFAAFGVGPRSVVAGVREDVQWAAEVEQRTVGAYAAEWETAIRAIAESPKYAGLTLAPQIGLIPLGFDPHSGLYEFYHLRSATPGTPLPARDPHTGRFTVAEDTGLVFVLLPGGRTMVGAQKTDPAAPYYDPGAELGDLDLREVLLDPFLLSKYELTQGQWVRLTRQELEGEFPAGVPCEWEEEPSITLAHPFDGKGDAHRGWHLLARHDLQLPLEEQWEYACRAGTTTPWYTGTAPASLVGHANVGDPTAGARFRDWGEGGLEVPDGYVVHAPVGRFEPNAFGLHDMLGNVNELCRTKGGKATVFRGGSFRTVPARARCVSSRAVPPDHGHGLRVTRPLQPLLFGEVRWPPNLDPGRSTACLCADLDQDGDQDIFRCGRAVIAGEVDSRARCWLYLNDGSGTFRDVSETHLPAVFVEALADEVEAGDLDGDGDLDLVWVGQHDEPRQNRLYLNAGGARFVDATATHLPRVEDSSAGLGLGDLDGDGDLDMLVANRGGDAGERNRMYLNDGSGRFREVTDTHLPPTPPEREEDMTQDLALGDVDSDGDLDFVCGNLHYGYQNRLYRNDGSGHFTDVTETCLPGIHYDRGGQGDITQSVDLGDVDGDGDLDLVCANGWGVRWQRNRLYLNDGTGRFVDVSESQLPADQTRTVQVRLADLDGDGDLDLLGSTEGWAGFANRLLLNDGTGRFREASATHVRIKRLGPFALADLDGDGDLDVVGDRIYRNRSVPPP